MEELYKFVFGTIVCDGCACRIDSKDADDERLYDIDYLLDCKLEDHGWVKQSKDKWYCPKCAKDPSHRTHPGEGRVIVENTTLSGLRCDHCGATFESSEGYSCWEDSSYTEDHSRDEDWHELDGKMLCPDCWRTCDAMEDAALDDDAWEETYCSKCPHKDNCDEVVEREVPDVSLECNAAMRVSKDGRVKYEPCPYLVPNPVKGLREKCNLPKGQKCPRVEAWEIDKEKVKRNNDEIREWVKNRGEETSTPLKA